MCSTCAGFSLPNENRYDVIHTQRFSISFPSKDLTTYDRGRSILTRMVRCILSVLKAKGSKGIHVEVDEENYELCEFYFNLGFKTIDKNEQLNKSRIGRVTLGRML